MAHPAEAARRIAPAARIVPLSGAHAALGRSMARAAALAQGSDKAGLIVMDAAAGAAAAARAALKAGAGLILGPLLAEDVAPVLAAVGGRVPVVTFSNDRRLRDDGAFVIGITADQIATGLLRYARGRGIRRIAIAVSGDPWGQQVEAAARAAAPREDLEITALAEAEALVASTAEAAAGRGDLQLLLVPASADIDPPALRRLQGTWLAAPDPAAFESFAAAFEAANGSAPGVIAGLAYDAATMAQALRSGGGIDRPALLARPFTGVCGSFTFRDDGSAARALAILLIDAGGYRVVDRGGEGSAR